jgi:hypothetical protein
VKLLNHCETPKTYFTNITIRCVGYKDMRIERHITEQDVDEEGEVHTFCGVCGKDWGYYNSQYKWLVFKIWFHSLLIRIIFK